MTRRADDQKHARICVAVVALDAIDNVPADVHRKLRERNACRFDVSDDVAEAIDRDDGSAHFVLAVTRRLVIERDDALDARADIRERHPVRERSGEGSEAIAPVEGGAGGWEEEGRV